eukprot:scaffold5239_cov34-Prasinocladus_malaysianus.AAC.3
MRGGYDRAMASASRAWALLRHAPCLVPFQERAKVFQMLVSADRREVRGRQVGQGLRLICKESGSLHVLSRGESRCCAN